MTGWVQAAASNRRNVDDCCSFHGSVLRSDEMASPVALPLSSHSKQGHARSRDREDRCASLPVRPFHCLSTLTCDDIRQEVPYTILSHSAASLQLNHLEISSSSLLPNAILADQDADAQNWGCRHFECDGRMDLIGLRSTTSTATLGSSPATSLSRSRSPAPTTNSHSQHMNGFSMQLPPHHLDINATVTNSEGHAYN